ncbi:beta-carotene 3-hydroxylase [Williamwhitmania taraxaci]|uniref:Beta-carotene 3-hydroxylase n=2 Tax=Williamwhitmania taraxaci TaxID=1640674 RepID=A0A1G6IAH1_9BACT|nr:beta-carotene 3-hydroxylase [Williamwhitmania taraxaci]
MVNIVLLILAYFFMEFVAWSNHKYVMHGFLWNWHIDHHRKDNLQGLPLNTEDKLLEKNDLFFLVYAIPAIILMIVGFSIQSMPMVFVSVGITLYGFTYFAIHDIIIHNRIKISFLQGKHNFFIEAVIKAHTAHHKPKNKQDFNNYGLLVFPLKFLKS